MVHLWSTYSRLRVPKVSCSDFQISVHSHSYRQVSITYRVERFCHGRGREFESRRPRQLFQGLREQSPQKSNPQFNPQLTAPPPA